MLIKESDVAFHLPWTACMDGLASSIVVERGAHAASRSIGTNNTSLPTPLVAARSDIPEDASALSASPDSELLVRCSHARSMCCAWPPLRARTCAGIFPTPLLSQRQQLTELIPEFEECAAGRESDCCWFGFGGVAGKGGPDDQIDGKRVNGGDLCSMQCISRTNSRDLSSTAFPISSKTSTILHPAHSSCRFLDSPTSTRTTETLRR